MTNVAVQRHAAEEKNGLKLHRFSAAEFARLQKSGAIRRQDPVELVNGLLAIKKQQPVPFGVPNGIPPEILWEGTQLLDRRPLRRLTVQEFDRLVDHGVIESDVRFELAEGWVVDKMARNPPHDATLQMLLELLHDVIPHDLKIRSQMAVTLDESKYEPDVAIVPGPSTRYRERHPLASEVLLLVEVSAVTLRFDRGIKLRSYARNLIETYWIVNLPKGCVEVYTEPSGPTDQPSYGHCEKFLPGQKIPLRLKANKTIEIAVSDFLNP